MDRRYYDIGPFVKVKEEVDWEENGYYKSSHLASKASLYPEISFIPVRKTMDFKLDYLMPQPIKPEANYPQQPIKPEANYAQPPILPPLSTQPDPYPDPLHPHCKRKPLPLEKCPVCKKFFRRMSTHLQKHAEYRGYHGENSLSCKFCSKIFTNLGNLSIHLRTHTGTKPYICDVCSKGFAQSCNLTNHKRIHTGERPFKCPYCTRAFTQSGNLSNHIRLHLDLKPFKCHYCDKAFTQSGNLNSHIKNNHKEETVLL